MNLWDIDFYFITDSNLTKTCVLDDVKAALEAGVRIVQYREEKKSTREMLEESRIIRDLCIGRAFFIVNNRIDIAMAVNADGVHLGQKDMPYEAARRILGEDKIIGLTAHNIDEAVRAENLGAEYVGASPIFRTDTKPDAGEAAGPDLLRTMKTRISIPIVAIGGIKIENVNEVITAGAHSACAISAVLIAEDTAEECRKFIRKIRAARNP